MTASRSLPALFARDPEPPIERAALALACDYEPGLDVEAWVARLDDLAAPLARRARDAATPAAQAAALGTFAFDELGFRGNEANYYDPANSLLHRVIETRQGIPITLAAVLMALGARAGLDVEGVGFPGHFLVRVGGPDGVMVDPFFHGRVLDASGLLALLRRTQGPDAALQPEHLAPVGARAMIVRMLNNLRAIWANHRDHARAMLACDRLCDLTGAPEFRRDRGLHAASLGLRDAALDDLRAYLVARPGASDAVTVRARVAELGAATKRTMQ